MIDAAEPTAPAAGEAGSGAVDDSAMLVLPVVHETLQVGVRLVETGRVRIATRVSSALATQSVTLRNTRIRVERIEVDRVEDVPPQPRQADGVTIIPVFEEILVIRYRVTGEVHVIEESQSEDMILRETLRRSDVEIERLPPQTGDGRHDSR